MIIINDKKINYRKYSILFFSILIIICCKNFIINNKVINGNSMNDTFYNNDVVLIKKFNKTISRYDIVVINAKEPGLKKSIIKRVIGLPGEEIQIKNGVVYINNKKLQDDVVNEYIEDGGIANKIFKLEEDEYFVLGDNRNNSEDSRSEWLGSVKIGQIEGKVCMQIYPFDKIRIIN